MIDLGDFFRGIRIKVYCEAVCLYVQSSLRWDISVVDK